MTVLLGRMPIHHSRPRLWLKPKPSGRLRQQLDRCKKCGEEDRVGASLERSGFPVPDFPFAHNRLSRQRFLKRVGDSSV